MASALLAKLKVKPVPAKEESIVVKINKPEPAVDENVDLKVKIEDKTRQKLINRDEFLQRMKRVKETVTKIPETPKFPQMPHVSKKTSIIPEQSYKATQDKVTQNNTEQEDDNEPSIFIVKPKKIGKLILIPCLDIGKLTYKRESPPLSKSIKPSKLPKLKVIGEDGEIQDKPSKPSKAKETKEIQGVFEGEIEDPALSQRLPAKSEKILLKADSYYLNNRKFFINSIDKLFAPYKKELEEDESKLTCDSMTGEFSLLTHQKLVRDYINIYTPYRGLLLYHGLGSGKTCSSIAIAEGIKTDKQVVIMTPASLQSNYRKELMKCGDSIYKKNQYWEFVLTKGDTDLENKLSSMLGLTLDNIRKKKGAWLVDQSQEANYNTLDTHKKGTIDEQINNMIENKYKFINYNGLRMSRLSELTNEFKENYFDNKVIIIDEAHNLISRIVNKLKSKTNIATKCKPNATLMGDMADKDLEDEIKKNIFQLFYINF